MATRLDSYDFALVLSAIEPIIYKRDINYLPNETASDSYDYESENGTYENNHQFSERNLTGRNVSVRLSVEQPEDLNNYWALLAIILVIGTACGNILVCLAIAWEKRLQNVTNYFLASLAITDLMVAVLVMPLGIVTLFRGESDVITFPKCFKFKLPFSCFECKAFATRTSSRRRLRRSSLHKGHSGERKCSVMEITQPSL